MVGVVPHKRQCDFESFAPARTTVENIKKQLAYNNVEKIVSLQSKNITNYCFICDR